jgi:hypothetical protein
MQHLLRAAPELLSACERVALKSGPWPVSDGQDDDSLYFPETGLLALSLPAPGTRSWTPRSARLALLGCHGVWSPRQALNSDFLAEVLVPGDAMRVAESVVRSVDVPLAKWWMQVAASKQHLIHQMARMALCAHKHSPAQTLASCLLMAQFNSAARPLPMPMVALRDWLGWPPDAWQSAWDALDSQGAVVQVGQGATATIQIQALDTLTGLACACHPMVGLDDAGKGSRDRCTGHNGPAQ